MSFGARVWYAYHCLPREKDGSPPELKGFERGHGLSNGVMQKLFDGRQHAVSIEVLPRLAAALGVSAEFLAHGTGPWPEPTGPVPDRIVKWNGRERVVPNVIERVRPPYAAQMLDRADVAMVVSDHTAAESFGDSDPAERWRALVELTEKDGVPADRATAALRSIQFDRSIRRATWGDYYSKARDVLREESGRKRAVGERALKPERRTSPSGSFSFDVPPPSTVPPAAEGKGRHR